MAATRCSIVRHDVVVLDERHLDVELGELGLAVGAQVLVAEAAGDLEVAVEARRPSGAACRAAATAAGRRNGRRGPGWGPGSRGRPSGVLRPRIGVSTSRKPWSRHHVPHELGQPVAEDEDPLHGRAGGGRGSGTSAAAPRWARARAISNGGRGRGVVDDRARWPGPRSRRS